MIQPFEFENMSILGTVLITPFSAGDDRGNMIKDYSLEIFPKNGISFNVAETLYITSHKNVLRGLHFQREKEQAKLVRCISGRVWSVVVDLRKGTDTFGKWISVELDQESGKELFIPVGCAFGTLALETSLISCKCGEKFYAEYDDGIRWDDPDLDVRWPIEALDGAPIISAKDEKLQSFQSCFSKKID